MSPQLEVNSLWKLLIRSVKCASTYRDEAIFCDMVTVRCRAEQGRFSLIKLTPGVTITAHLKVRHEAETVGCDQCHV